MDEQTFGHIRFIPGSNGGRYPNCHSIFVEGANVLIDPGADRKVLKALKEEKKISQIWLTHWHEDHILNLDLFEDIPLYTSQAAAVPLQDINAFMDAYGASEELKSLWKPVMEKQFHFRPRKPAGYLKAATGEEIGPVHVDIIDTPGHAVGHLSFYFPENDVLVMGDYDLSGFGPWYGDADSDIKQTIASVKRLEEIDARICLASHETGVFIHPEKDLWNKDLAVIDKRQEKILKLLSSPQTLEELVNSWVIYEKPREPLVFYQFGERGHIIKHLDRLIAGGQVVSDGEVFEIV
jgi:glyoxylase-like metal-dependent hydrolase (beta-lactamase superfamily II)